MRDLTKERIVLLLVLGGSVFAAPFFLFEWVAVTVLSLLALQTWQWLFPHVAAFETPKRVECGEVKKRVTIIEHKNSYISEVTDQSSEEVEPPMPSIDRVEAVVDQAATSKESDRSYEDIKAKVTGLRIRGAGCSGSAEAEYKLQIVTPDGKTWRVWRNYDDIHRVHALVERVLENDKSRRSLFTRIVPSIPSRNFSSLALLFESRRSIMHRRRTGLDEFVSRIFGEKSADHYRMLALKIPQVREFLDLSKTDTQFPKKALRKPKSSWWARHMLFRKEHKSRPASNSSYLSSESEE